MSSRGECYACVCVREFPAQSLLRMRPDLRNKACVVMDGQPPLEQVCSLNRKARELGLARGMTKVEVQTVSNVSVLTRSFDEESSAKAALLECAGYFSPRMEDCSLEWIFLCAIDIAGTDKLFGSPEALSAHLRLRMQRLGIAASIAISSNFHVAVLAAKSLTLRNPIKVIPVGGEREALSSLSLEGLDLEDEKTEIFSLWGIRTLGMLADLPEKELIARLGQEGKRLRQLAEGNLPHVLRPVEPVFALREHLDLEAPVEMLDTLLFVANTMLEQIILRASERVLAIAEVKITFMLERAAKHERKVRPALPTNDRQLWLKLLHLDLEAHPPQSAIHSVTIEAQPGKTSKVQLGLFSPQLPESSRLDVTLARIAAIVGERNVGSAELLDTHSPQGFRIKTFRVPSSKAIEKPSSSIRPALRRLRPAESISVVLSAGKPLSFSFRGCRYVVERAYGPWTRSGEWWNPLLWGCEQWELVTRTQNGETLCCCISRDAVHGTWQMDAFYD